MDDAAVRVFARARRRGATAPAWTGTEPGPAAAGAGLLAGAGRLARAGLLAGVALAGLALAGALALGCARPAPPSRPLRIAVHSDPLVLDPHLRNEALTYAVLRNFYEGLTAFDTDMRVGPALAASWENPNDLTWVFHLRPGVRFHDGRELTAADVVWSVERARSLPASGFGSYLVAVEGVRALDLHTVELTTRRPYAILLNKLAFVLVVPAGSPPEIRQPVGTGPYRLASYQPGARLELRSFDAYWDGAPAEKRVEILPIRDAGERVARLQNGDVDVVQEPGPENAARIRATAGCRVLAQENLSVNYLLINARRPPLADRRVRRAIHLALDRSALVRATLGGAGRPIGQMVSRSVFGYAPDLPPPARDLPAARRLLAEAGYPGGIDLDLELRSGRRAEELRHQLAEAGIRVRLVERPWSELYPRLQRHEVDFFLGAILAPSADASDLFDALVHSRDQALGYGDSNFGDYHNPALDALIHDSGSTLDMLARRAKLERCMHLLMDDLTFIPLSVPLALFGVRDDVEWVPRRDGFILARDIRRRGEGGGR
jgi:peptide/nickel transport system substrate-binding protein